MSTRPLLSWQIVAVVVLLSAGLIERHGLPESVDRLRFRSGPMRFMDYRLEEIIAAERAPDALRVVALGNSLMRFSLGTGEELNAALDVALPDTGVEAHILAFPSVAFLHFEPFLYDVIRTEPDLLVLQIDLFYPTGARDSMRAQELWSPLGETLLSRPEERTIDDLYEIRRDWSDLVLSDTHSLAVGERFLAVTTARKIPVIVLEVPVSRTLHGVVPVDYFDDRAARLTARLQPETQRLIRARSGISDKLTADYRHLNAEGQTHYIEQITPAILEALGR